MTYVSLKIQGTRKRLECLTYQHLKIIMQTEVVLSSPLVRARDPGKIRLQPTLQQYKDAPTKQQVKLPLFRPSHMTQLESFSK